jgi:hypothetical protein
VKPGTKPINFGDVHTDTDHLSVHIVSTETYNCVCELVGTFESVGKSELQDAGKAGLVTVQGKISVVLGTVLISKIIGLCCFRYIFVHRFFILSYIWAFMCRCLPVYNIFPGPG